jgi:hypothetical protein
LITAEIYNRYDLCCGEWSGGVYSSQDEVEVQSLADALNELERHDSAKLA